MFEKFTNTTGQEFTLKDICSLIESSHDYNLYVGTDSQVHKKKRRKVKYVTCIVLHKSNSGGRIFINSAFEPPVQSLQQRLSHEVYRSVQLCFMLQEMLPSNVEIIVDVDLNKNQPHKSANYVHQLVGMVTGQGFKCRAKPDAWAASSVADRYSK